MIGKSTGVGIGVATMSSASLTSHFSLLQITRFLPSNKKASVNSKKIEVNGDIVMAHY